MKGIFIDLETAKKLAELERLKKKIMKKRKSAGGYRWKYVD